MPTIAAPTRAVMPRYTGANHISSQYDDPVRYRPSSWPRSVNLLLDQAYQGLLDAEYAKRPIDRYYRAHLAALRAAAAVLAARTRPRSRARPTSAWALLAKVAPELSEWSAFFSATSATRAAAEAGVHRLVTSRDADDLVRQASEFLAIARHAVARTFR